MVRFRILCAKTDLFKRDHRSVGRLLAVQCIWLVLQLSRTRAQRDPEQSINELRQRCANTCAWVCRAHTFNICWCPSFRLMLTVLDEKKTHSLCRPIARCLLVKPSKNVYWLCGRIHGTSFNIASLLGPTIRVRVWRLRHCAVQRCVAHGTLKLCFHWSIVAKAHSSITTFLPSGALFDFPRCTRLQAHRYMFWN